jgi:hypothetical protein
LRSFAVRSRHVKPVLWLCQYGDSSREWNVLTGGGPLRDLATLDGSPWEQLGLLLRIIRAELLPAAADRKERQQDDAHQVNSNRLGARHA